jgi:UDP-N-acetylmuramate dehydrogenase
MIETLSQQLLTELSEIFGPRLKCDELLSRHTTFGIGGPADAFVTVHTPDEMSDTIALCMKHSAPYFIIGGGSNILVADSGYRGLIIKCAIDRFLRDGCRITVGAGYPLERLIDEACDLGLRGIEMLAGIKGSVGGAIYGNAGAYGGAISDCLESALIAPPGGRPRLEPRNYFAFAYRNSILKRTHEVVLEATLTLSESPAEALKKERDRILEMRAQRHPETDCSAGCFFKNIEKRDEPFGKLSAGMLLEKVGAKDTFVGQAGVFQGHANIIVNLGGARADEVKRLASMLKEKVRDEFGYTLEEEITYVGEFN